MITVQRANVVLDVEDEEKQRYLDMGYSVIDERGEVVEAAIPTDLSILRYAYVEKDAKIKSLEKENLELKDKIKKLSNKKAKED